MKQTYTGRKRGFTLIELMVTIAIAAVALTLAAPSFVQFQRNSELTALTNKLLAAINTAKSEAMKTGRNALVVPNPTSNSWNDGWVVFVDADFNNEYAEGTDTLVQKQEKLVSYMEITVKDSDGIAASYIRFNSSGYSSRINGSTSVALSLTIKRTDSPEKRKITVVRTGRVRSCNPATDTTCTS